MSITDPTSARPSSAALLAELVAADEIAELKARYFRFMDTKDWDAWGAVFAPHAVMDMTGEPTATTAVGLPESDNVELRWHGRETIQSMVSGALAGLVSCHHGHMQEIKLTSPTTARGLWSMQDLICRPGERPTGFRVYGHYHETYLRIDGRWHIESTRLTRLLVLPL